MMNRSFKKGGFSGGSALILAVVLTSLLAVVGVMFVMVARVDKIATAAISENRELNFAVETVITRIARELVLDVPGEPNQEYYDYPDSANNRWLASIEPYLVLHPTDPNLDKYYWRQISDVMGFLAWKSFATQNINVDPPGPRKVIREYPEITLDINGELDDQLADADGDGIADSKWIELDHITSSKGKPIYAAIRVIDSGGMLNVNTAYKFDPNEIRERIDGSSQTQLNLAALARQPGDTIDEINLARNPLDRPLLDYLNYCIWKIEDPCSEYWPFDISDEIELRYRYCITSQAQTRLESRWYDTIGSPNDFQDVPYDGYRNLSAHPKTWRRLDDWRLRVTQNPNAIEPDRRHLLTTYNMDRIINPIGPALNAGKMTDVNKDDVLDIYRAINAGILDADPNFVGADAIAAQTAANIIDFRDNDANVTAFPHPVSGDVYYGFERPCVYISEIAQSLFDPCDIFADANNPLNDPNIFDDPFLYTSYAIEFYKPYFEDTDPCGWKLTVEGNPSVEINWPGRNQYCVLLFEDACAPFIDPNGPTPLNGATGVDPNTVILRWPAVPDALSYDVYFGIDFDDVNDANGTFIINQPGLFYDPRPLALDTIYYWRIDDVNGPLINKGDVWSFRTGVPDANIIFIGNSRVTLSRNVDGNDIIVDDVYVPSIVGAGWLVHDPNDHYVVRSFQRDLTRHKCIRRLWDSELTTNEPTTLGQYNPFRVIDYPLIYPVPDIYIQAHPANTGFTNIGEIGMVFRKSCFHEVGEDPYASDRIIGYTIDADEEHEARFNLANPNYQQVFNYLTVFDPNADGIDNNGDGVIDSSGTAGREWKVPGRININTAPWYAIAQLPWVSAHAPNYELARAIVGYRDMLDLNPAGGPDYTGRAGIPGFASIGELNNVLDTVDPNYSMRYYALDSSDLGSFPDLTPGDTAPDDFEERDLIFSRISNLVAVRSDVFTAYILVRIGADGPQKRVVAILDRSDVYPGQVGNVRVVALHPVPDPR